MRVRDLSQLEAIRKWAREPVYRLLRKETINQLLETGLFSLSRGVKLDENEDWHFKFIIKPVKSRLPTVHVKNGHVIFGREKDELRLEDYKWLLMLYGDTYKKELIRHLPKLLADPLQIDPSKTDIELTKTEALLVRTLNGTFEIELDGTVFEEGKITIDNVEYWIHVRLGKREDAIELAKKVFRELLPVRRINASYNKIFYDGTEFSVMTGLEIKKRRFSYYLYTKQFDKTTVVFKGASSLYLYVLIPLYLSETSDQYRKLIEPMLLEHPYYFYDTVLHVVDAPYNDAVTISRKAIMLLKYASFIRHGENEYNKYLKDIIEAVDRKKFPILHRNVLESKLISRLYTELLKRGGTVSGYGELLHRLVGGDEG